jgi:HEAT repeat protein
LSESFDRPFFLDHLHWTSREDVAAKLVALAHGPDASVALRACHVLGAVATAELAPHLAALALRRDRLVGVRNIALLALARLDAPLSDATLDALLEEQPHVPHEGGEVPRLQDVVALARTEAQRAQVLTFLERAGRDVRAHLLARGLAIGEIRAPLLARWLADVDRDDPTALDREVSLHLRDRRVAAHVMVAYWRQRAIWTEEFWADIRYYPQLITLLSSEDLRLAAAEGFRLDLGQELEMLGAGGLRRTLRRAVLYRSFALRCPIEPWSERKERQYARELEVLEDWPEEGARIALGLLTGAVLHEDVRKDLVRILWRTRRAWGRRWLLPRVRNPEALDEVRAAAEEARDAPSPEDREVLRAMLAVPDEQVRCRAIGALDAIAELDPACARDEGLADILAAIASRPERSARLAAAVSLVRRGHRRFLALLRDACVSRDQDERWKAVEALGRLAQDEEIRAACVVELEAAATPDTSKLVQAAAVARLARLPEPGAHVGTFENALASPPAGGITDYALYGNAVLALGVVGGERALSALLRAAFQVRETCLWSVAVALRVALDHADAPPRKRLEAIGETGGFFWSGSAEVASR